MKVVFKMDYGEYRKGECYPAEKASETSVRFIKGTKVDFLNFVSGQAYDSKDRLIAVLSIKEG